MALNEPQRQATSDELYENLSLSGLTLEAITERLGRTKEETQDAFLVNGTDPRLVWQLRDLLEDAVEATGQVPVAYSVLTEQRRREASNWFGLEPNR